MDNLIIAMEIQRLKDIQWHLTTAEYHTAAHSLQPEIDNLSLQLINAGSV